MDIFVGSIAPTLIGIGRVFVSLSTCGNVRRADRFHRQDGFLRLHRKHILHAPHSVPGVFSRIELLALADDKTKHLKCNAIHVMAGRSIRWDIYLF